MSRAKSKKKKNNQDDHKPRYKVSAEIVAIVIGSVRSRTGRRRRRRRRSWWLLRIDYSTFGARKILTEHFYFVRLSRVVWLGFRRWWVGETSQNVIISTVMNTTSSKLQCRGRRAEVLMMMMMMMLSSGGASGGGGTNLTNTSTART